MYVFKSITVKTAFYFVTGNFLKKFQEPFTALGSFYVEFDIQSK